MGFNGGSIKELEASAVVSHLELGVFSGVLNAVLRALKIVSVQGVVRKLKKINAFVILIIKYIYIMWGETFWSSTTNNKLELLEPILGS